MGKKQHNAPSSSSTAAPPPRSKASKSAPSTPAASSSSKAKGKGKGKVKQHVVKQRIGAAFGSRGDASELNDEVDEFIAQRDQVRFGGSGADYGNGASADQDVQGEDEDEMVAAAMLHRRSKKGAAGGVLDLDVASDDEEDEAGDDEEDDGMAHGTVARWRQEEEEEEMAMRSARAKEAEDALSNRWGFNKKAYYQDSELPSTASSTATKQRAGKGKNKDQGAAEIRQAALDEEAEVKRMQREKAKSLTEDDFADQAMMGALLQSSSSSAKPNKSNTHTTLPLDTRTLQDNDEVERVSKDLSALSAEDRLELVLRDAPELIGLVDEFKTKIQELRDYIQPLVERVRRGELATEHGISYLEVKFHLLLNYCINVAFYLYLKADGQSVKSHPVIEQLVALRATMEKLRPIDSKLKYEIDKLVKLTAQPAPSADTTADPLSFKPRPDKLLKATAAPSSAGAAAGMDELGDASAELYRAPKHTAALSKEAIKRNKKLDRARAAALSSGLVKDLQAQLSDRPEEVSAFGADEYKPDALEEERREFEESNFVRLMETKKDRKRREANERRAVTGAGPLDDIGDWGDFSALEAAAAREDADLNLKELMGSKPASKKRKASDVNMGGDDEDFDMGLDEEEMAAGAAFYESVQKKSKQRKEQRQEEHQRPSGLLAEADPDKADGRREAGNQIVKNRGLTRSRPKKLSNPRIARRHKYEKAVKKRSSQVKQFKGKSDNYGGEATGIKSTTIKSRSLK